MPPIGRRVPGRERAERGHQRGEGVGAREDRVGDVLGEDPEDDEIIELERAPEAGEDDGAASRRRERSDGDMCRGLYPVRSPVPAHATVQLLFTGGLGYADMQPRGCTS